MFRTKPLTTARQTIEIVRNKIDEADNTTEYKDLLISAINSLTAVVEQIVEQTLTDDDFELPF